MQQLAILIIGLLAGILLAVIGLGVGFIVYLVSKQQKVYAEHQAKSIEQLRQSTDAMGRLRHDVTIALAAMDANRLHDASQGVQVAVKALQHTVASLSKLVFAAGAGDAGMGLSAIGDTGYDLYDPREEQAREVLGEMEDQLVDPMADVANFRDRPAARQRREGLNRRPAAEDPYESWRVRQAASAAKLSGSDFPAAPPVLPDLDEGYLEDAQDGFNYQSPDVPGMSELGDGPLGR